MAQETVLINFEVDYTELTNAQKQLEKTGKIDAKGFNDIQAAITETATDTKGLIRQFKDVAGASIKMGKTLENAFGAGVKDALDSAGVSVDEFADALKKANAPAITIKKELAQLKESMARMKAEGKDTGKEFDALRQKAGKLADAIQDANAEIKNAGSDTRGIDNVVGSISALAGGYAAVQGAAALFGEENEDVQKALLKVNAAMALAQGLQIVYNATLKEGALTKLADSVATGAQVAATTLLTFVTGGATVAARAYRVALLATGIGAIVILVVALVAAFKNHNEKVVDAKKAIGELEDAYSNLTTTINTYNNEAAQIAQAQGKAESEVLKIRLKGLQDLISANRKLEDEKRDAVTKSQKNGKVEKELADAVVKTFQEGLKLKSEERVLEAQITAAIKKEYNDRLTAEQDFNKKKKEALDKALRDLKDRKDREEKLFEEEQEKIRQREFDKNKWWEKRGDDFRAAELKKKKEFYKKALEFLKQSRQDELDADADFYEARWEQAGTDLAKSEADAKAKADAQIKEAQRYLGVAQQVAGLIGQLASIQTQRDMEEIASMRKVVDERLKAGDITDKQAEAQRKRIEKIEAKARYDAAVREKKSAVFEAVLAIPVAFLNGLSVGGPTAPVFAALYAALAAAQAAIIISKPIPKFFRGKKDSYEGPGIVGDMGTELVERNGRMFLYTKPTETYLGAKDKVYTASETKQILHNTNISTTVKEQKPVQFDYEKFGQAIPANSININIDKDFISESVAAGLSRTNYMDRRYSSK